MSYEAWFEALYALWYERLYQYIVSLLSAQGPAMGRIEAQDCLQEVFLLAWHKRQQLSSHPKAHAWLFKCAYYVVKNRLSVERVKAKHESPHDLGCTESGVTDRASLQRYGKERDQELTGETLERLREMTGEASFSMLLDYYDKDKGVKAICAQTGLSPSGVKMRVKRLIDRLRKKRSDITQ